MCRVCNYFQQHFDERKCCSKRCAEFVRYGRCEIFHIPRLALSHQELVGKLVIMHLLSHILKENSDSFLIFVLYVVNVYSSKLFFVFLNIFTL